MNALKVLTLSAYMGTAQKTTPSMTELCFWLYSCIKSTCYEDLHVH